MVLDDPYFDAQWLRTAGHSGAGGAELGECLAVAGAIRGSDIESWYAAWLAMGERVLARAEESRAAGRDVSAREAYLRASNYLALPTPFSWVRGRNPGSLRRTGGIARHSAAPRRPCSLRRSASPFPTTVAR
jgi:hypothetical protein